jgi:hypothetical protein
MRQYLKNLFTAFIYGSIFGIIYNVIIYIVSPKAFKNYTYDWRMIPVLLYKKVNDDALQKLLEITSKDLFMICFHGIIQSLDIIVLGLIFMLLLRNEDNFTKQLIWKKTLLFFLFSTLVIAFLFLIGSVIWAMNNKKISWFPSDVVFERYLPAMWMGDGKSVYFLTSIIFSVIFYFKIKKKMKIKYS